MPITPSNPIRKSKPEKARKASGFGVSFATEGGKDGGMKTDQGGREVKQIDMSVIIGLTDVYGPETTVPGVAPDGSNPFKKEYDGSADPAPAPTSTTQINDDKIQIKIPETTFDNSANSKGANSHYKDTIVNRVDSARVMKKSIKNDKAKIDNFNKRNGTDF